MALGSWSRREPRRALLALSWMLAVGCCMHAFVDMVARVLSLAGRLTIDHPASALLATALLSVVGLLSARGVIGRMTVL
jgi:hypothetical protein